MTLTKELDNYLRKNIPGYLRAYSITERQTDYKVEYLKKIQHDKRPPSFLPSSEFLDLKVFKRDSIISDTLDSIFSLSDFDVEEVIYTDEQREKIEKLRKENKDMTAQYYEDKKRLEIEYSETFKVGQRVWLKGEAGIITFKHYTKKERNYNWKSRSYEEADPVSRYSVKVRNIEYRYVYGTSLLNRIPEDLSNIIIDEKLNKLSTERLLRMYKTKRNKNCGRGDMKIKAILNQREHIQEGETIVKMS